MDVMRDKTEINIWHAGDKIVSTVHRIHHDGTESSEVLSMADPVELTLEEDTPKRVVKGEHVYDWQR